MPSPTNLPPLTPCRLVGVSSLEYTIRATGADTLTESDCLEVIHRSNTQPGLLEALKKLKAAVDEVSRDYGWKDARNCSESVLLKASFDTGQVIAAAEKGVA